MTTVSSDHAVPRLGVAKLFTLASFGAVLVFSTFGAFEAKANAPVTDCDHLAAHPADPNRVGKGVQWDLIDGRRAVAACRAAVSRYPNSTRLKFQLGRALVFTKQRDEGLSYLFDAANGNYPIAYSLIGGTYQFDIGNLNEALKWYKRGTAVGDVSSQTHLADMYLYGQGVERNLATALSLFRPSADNGYALSVYKIGSIYWEGDRNVRRNPALAVQWYQKAAKLGFARAQNDLGHAYESGDGVTRRFSQAVSWYRLAADQGWGLAQNNLARLYERGLGLKKDFKEAFYWYRLASTSRHRDIQKRARDGVARLRNRLSSAQLVEVDQRLDAWRSVTPQQSAQSPQLAKLVPQVRDEVIDESYTPPAPATEVKTLEFAGGGGADSGYRPPTQANNNQSLDSGLATTTSATDDVVDTGYLPPGLTQQAGNTTSQAATSQASNQTAALPTTSNPATANVAISPRYGRFMARTKVNVRALPGTHGAKIASLEKGQEVIALGQVQGADWLMVNLPNGMIGYVSQPYLIALDGGTQTATTTAQAVTAPSAAPTQSLASVDFGNYHALVIGNNDYKHLPKLDTAVNDARRVSEILRDKYGFQVQTLLDVTRADIVIALDRLRSKLTPKDNLLIYYGGHGILDESSERGYWLPVDATADTQVSWVSNATITDTLKAMAAQHVMLVVDSCYSGTLTRSALTRGLQSPDYYQRILGKRARVALTSGGLEPVLDGGGQGHSVFARAFIDALLANESIMDGNEMFQVVRRPVILNASQTPEFSDVRFSGHGGGDFLFVRRNL